jgi:RNA polymerase sigma factor (sigma-70 family)
MPDHETTLGGARGGSFPTTSWSILKRLRNPDSAGFQEAMRKLAETYWKPVYCQIRHSWGKSNEDAKDLTQEFFTTMILEKSMAAKFLPERGSFRSFLKASVTNFLRDANKTAGRAKRGGNAEWLSLQGEGFDLSDVVADPSTLTPDQVFDEAWKNLVLGRAVERMEKKLRSEGRDACFEVFRRYEIDPAGPEPSYKSVGEALGLTPDAVKNQLMRARQEFKEAVTEELSDTVDCASDLEDEIRELFGGRR